MRACLSWDYVYFCLFWLFGVLLVVFHLCLFIGFAVAQVLFLCCLLTYFVWCCLGCYLDAGVTASLFGLRYFRLIADAGFGYLFFVVWLLMVVLVICFG